MWYQNCYKFTGIDLSRQTNTRISQQINFVGKLEHENNAEKQQKTVLNFSSG